MFREPEGTTLFDTDHLSDALNNADAVNMDIHKGSGSKDTSGNFPVRILTFQ